MNLDDDDLARVQALVGHMGMSKFDREAVREKLDQVAPGGWIGALGGLCTTLSPESV